MLSPRGFYQRWEQRAKTEGIKSNGLFWSRFDTHCGFPSAIHDKSRLSPSLVKPSGYVTTIFTSGLSEKTWRHHNNETVRQSPGDKASTL